MIALSFEKSDIFLKAYVKPNNFVCIIRQLKSVNDLYKKLPVF